MKKLLALTFLIGLGMSAVCGEVFDRAKEQALIKIYREKQQAGANDAAQARQEWQNYLLTTELNTDARDNYTQLYTIIENCFKESKISNPTAEQIDAKINELWKAEYDPENRKELLRAHMYARHGLPEAIEKLNGGARYASPLWSGYIYAKQYEKALETAVKYELWPNAFDAAKRLKEPAKIFEYGRKYFLNAYIATPAQASRALTDILRPNYTGVIDNEEIAEFLKEISMRYPAPDADMEAWRGFLGFVGYRYKTLTGQDLFVK